MKILILSPVHDPAGVGVNLAYAIKNHTDNDCKLIIGVNTNALNRSFLAGIDHTILAYEQDFTKLIEAIEWADLVHYNQAVNFEDFYGGQDRFIGAKKLLCMKVKNAKKEEFDFEDLVKDKPLVIHGHGGIWLLNPEPLLERCQDWNAVIATCSPIDEQVVPGIRWVPNVLPISQDIYQSAEKNFDGELICSQAAHDSLYKGGGIVKYVFDWLPHIEKGFDVKFEPIGKLSIEEAMEKRRSHHFTIDSWVQGFHGMAGLEGLALGQIVFSRFDPMAKEKWRGFSEEMIPIIDVKGMDEFAKYLRLFNNDRELLKKKCQESRAWMEKNYNEKRVVGKWIELYREILGLKTNGLEFEQADNKLSSVKKCVNEKGLIMASQGKVRMFDFTGLTPIQVKEGIGVPEKNAFVAGKIPVDGQPAIYDILRAVEGQWHLHKFLKDVQIGKTKASYFSLEPMDTSVEGHQSAVTAPKTNNME